MHQPQLTANQDLLVTHLHLKFAVIFFVLTFVVFDYRIYLITLISIRAKAYHDIQATWTKRPGCY